MNSVSREACCLPVGENPTTVKARNRIAWIVSVREIERSKPIDKACLGQVSDWPGLSVSKPRCSLEKFNLVVEPFIHR